MFELRIPIPIRTWAARITIEGEHPTFGPDGLVTPSWSVSSHSLWGGDNEVMAPDWSSGTAYPATYVARYSGYIYQSPTGGISAGDAPAPGTESGGFYGALGSSGDAVSFTGVRETFKVSTDVTVQGVTIYGLDGTTYGHPPGGINSGTRVGIADPAAGLLDSNNNYESYVYLAEGMYTGPDGSLGEVHIPFNKPVRLLADGTTTYTIIVGDTQASLNAVFCPSVHANSPSSPVSDVPQMTSGVGPGRDSNLGGANLDSRLYFRLWTTPWIYLPDAIDAPPRDSRFLVFVGPSGLAFSEISDDMMTEVVLAVDGYSGVRNSFKVSDVVPAATAVPQSVYVKYAPTNLPSGGPHGVAIYNITAEEVAPPYQLGPHSTSATFS